MPIISSLNTKNASRADDRHRNNPVGDAVRDKIFKCVIYYVSHGQRNISYKDMAEYAGVDIGAARYHFRKLVAVEAIRLREK